MMESILNEAIHLLQHMHTSIEYKSCVFVLLHSQLSISPISLGEHDTPHKHNHPSRYRRGLTV